MNDHAQRRARLVVALAVRFSRATLNESLTRKMFTTIQVSEDFLRTMIDKIPILAWSCRLDGTTEFLNQRWLDYTGVSMEEALGWGWKAAIHGGD
jgi:PAS domain-containing protein